MKLTKNPAPVKGREELSKLGGKDNTKIRTEYHPRLALGKNRIKILEQIEDRRTRRGYYPNPNRAMEALLGGVK